MTQTLQSVSQALRVLTALRHRENVGVTELAAELSIAPSTTHRILSTLQEHGFAEQTPSGRRYRLGPAMSHSSDAASIEHCIEVSQPVMHRLRDRSNETVHISVLEGAEARFVAVVESRQLLRVSSRIGRSIPAHTAASGKVLLAQLSDDTIDALYPSENLPRPTSRSHSTRASLKAELQRVRELGYGYGRNFGESEAGLAAIAMPVRRPADIPICSLTLTGPLARFNPTGESGISRREIELREMLVESASELEQKLQY